MWKLGEVMDDKTTEWSDHLWRKTFKKHLQLCGSVIGSLVFLSSFWFVGHPEARS